MDAANKLLWVNGGVHAAATSGQTNPYPLFSYDPCGRMSSRERRDDRRLLRSYSFVWDGDDRLRQVNEGATRRFTASYDGDGVRVSKTDSWSGTHNYSWGPGGLLADSSASTTYTPGLSQRQGSTDRFFQDDWLGNTRYLSDSSGNGFPKTARYTAFGERSLDWGTDPYAFSDFQFAGGAGYQTEYASSTEPGLGLQYLQERYYDPAVGRFVSQDQIGLSDYSYAGNDPSGLVDPSGLEPVWDWWHDQLHGLQQQGQTAVNNAWATNGFGVAAATVENTVAEVGFGFLDLPAGIAHLPEAWAHWGEGTGRFAANPSLETVSGLGNDALTLAGTFFLLRGGVRGAVRLGEAIEARSPGFFSRCRRGSISLRDAAEEGPRTRRGQIRGAGLPANGRYRYVPPENWRASTGKLPRGPGNGYLDKFGNEWQKGPAHHFPGDPYEWDVQVPGGGHLNVSAGGTVR